MSVLKKVFVLFAIIMLAAAAGTGVKAKAANDGVKLSDRKVSIETGQTYKLRVENTKDEIKWESSDKKIAKVSSKGRITAQKAGSCKIYAYVGTKKLTCRVTVYNNYSAVNDKYSISGFSTLMGKLPLKKFKYDDANADLKELSTLGKNCVVYFGLDSKGVDVILDSDNYVYFIKNIIKNSGKNPDNRFLLSLVDTAAAAYENNALFEDANGNEYYAVFYRESDFDNYNASVNDADKDDEGFFFVFYPNKKGTDYDCLMIGCDGDSFEHITWEKQ